MARRDPGTLSLPCRLCWDASRKAVSGHSWAKLTARAVLRWCLPPRRILLVPHGRFGEPIKRTHRPCQRSAVAATARHLLGDPPSRVAHSNHPVSCCHRGKPLAELAGRWAGACAKICGNKSFGIRELHNGAARTHASVARWKSPSFRRSFAFSSTKAAQLEHDDMTRRFLVHHWSGFELCGLQGFSWTLNGRA